MLVHRFANDHVDDRSKEFVGTPVEIFLAIQNQQKKSSRSLRQLPIFGQQILLPAGLFWPIGTPTRQPPKVLDRVHQYSHSCPGQPVDHASHSVPQKNCQLHGVGPKAVRVAEIIQTAKGGFACAQGVSIIVSFALLPATSKQSQVLLCASRESPSSPVLDWSQQQVTSSKSFACAQGVSIIASFAPIPATSHKFTVLMRAPRERTNTSHRRECPNGQGRLRMLRESSSAPRQEDFGT